MPIGGCSVGLPNIQPILVAMATWSCFPLPFFQCSLPTMAHVSPSHRARGGYSSHRGWGETGMAQAITLCPPTQRLAPTMSPVQGATWGREGSGPWEPLLFPWW